MTNGLFLLLLVASLLHSQPGHVPRSIPVPEESLPTTYVDITRESGVNFKNEASHTPQKYLLETMVGGVAIFDYDQDNRLDLFFLNGAHLAGTKSEGDPPDKTNPLFWNRLYHNNGDETFTDVTDSAGVQGNSYGMGAAVADYDNDGLPDLYVTNFGSNILYHNNGDGTFSDVTKQAGVGGDGWSASAGFIDYDRDGFLDLVVTRYLEWSFTANIYCGEKQAGSRSYCHPDHFKPATHLVYHNNRDGTFTDVSHKSGVGAFPAKGLGISFNDFDRDGWPDIVIANDSWPQQLFQNKHDGTFDEVGLQEAISHDENGRTFAGMGVDFQDYTNDGWPDVFINALANQRFALFQNVGGTFENVTERSRVGSITVLHSGWGTRFLDYDNDGWKDIFVGQGHSMDTIELTQPSLRYREPLLLMRNVHGKFEDVSSRSGEAFQVPWAARGVALGDLNDDGFLDIVINNNDQRAVLLRNRAESGNHWLLVNTVGAVSNRDGIGAQLRLVSDSGLAQYQMVSTAASYMSASDKRVHFGLGRDTGVKLLEIVWPSGIVQRLEDLPSDQVITVEEPRRGPKLQEH